MTTWKTIALTILLAGATAAGLAAQSLELVSRVHTSQYSDTATGVRPVRYEDDPGTHDVPTRPSLSADGRYAVFLSSANNLVPGQKDLNASNDVFLQDLVAGTTILVSHAMGSPATAGNERSFEAVISADGTYVAFVSRATDLVPGQEGDVTFGLDTDLLLYDRATGATTLVAETKEQLSFFTDLAISADGRYIAFACDADDLVPGAQGISSTNVFLYDRIEGTIRLVSHTSASATTSGSGRSSEPAISADGRFVAFQSNAFDLLPEQSSTDNVFLFDRLSGNLSLAGPGNVFAMSADGRYTTILASGATFLYARETRETTVLDDSSGTSFLRGGGPPVAMSADGRFIAFIRAEFPPLAFVPDLSLVLYDRVSRTFTRISQPGTPTSTADAASLSISADGRYVAFTSLDQELVPGQSDVISWDVFLFDRTSQKITLVSHASGSSSTTGNTPSYSPVISAHGDRIAFWSAASNLVPDVNDLNQSYDLFVHHRTSGSTTTVTLRSPALPSLSPAGWSEARALSADGRYVAFQSDSSHLVAGQEDANGSTDVFLYDRVARSTILVSRSKGSPVRTANKRSGSPVLSADGRYVAFVSAATDLVTGTVDPNTSCDVFLFDRVAGSTVLVGRTDLACEAPGFSVPSADLRMSPDGRWVAFTSRAGDLVPGQRETEGFGTLDVFLWDRVSRSTVLVSRSNAGAAVAGNAESFAPKVSADGRYVAFVSRANDLVAGQIDSNDRLDLFLFDRATRRSVLVSHLPNSVVTAASLDGGHFSMSADAQFIAFASQENLDPATGSGEGVYLYDRTRRTNKWIAPVGFFAQPELSADGRFLAFFSPVELIPQFYPGTHPQLYVHDRITKTLTLITKPSVPNGRASSGYPGNLAISADGRFIAFNSDAVDLVPGQVSAPDRDDEDVFLFDRTSGAITLVSRLQTSPLTAVGRSGPPLLSASGRQVAFTSEVSLGDGDMNNLADAYLFQVSSPVALPPCKLLDTRRRADRPALRSDTRRTVRAAGVCGVPATAKSVSVTVTALQATGKGNLRFYAGNDTINSSGILRFEKNATRSATFNLPLATNNAGTLAILPFVAGKGTVQVVVEVNGYSQ
ncbi:MAG TPA: hypothetical protein VF789_07060 [Thermoanaerobaculia bacterium]